MKLCVRDLVNGRYKTFGATWYKNMNGDLELYSIDQDIILKGRNSRIYLYKNSLIY